MTRLRNHPQHLGKLVLELVWVEFYAVIGKDPRRSDPGHPLGCHRLLGPHNPAAA